MQHLWAVTHHIVGGVQQPDGRVTRANPSVIRPGDFVDVAVTIQVVSFRLPGGRRGVDVMFVPQTIVRLCNSEQSVVRELNPVIRLCLTLYLQAMLRTVNHHVDGNEERATVVRRDVGFEFDADEVEMQA